MKKIKKFKPNPVKLTYEELEIIVQAHRTGDETATTRLINGFYSYMNKFKRLIVNGMADITDREIRSFVGLFMSKERAMVLHQFRRNKNSLYEMYKTIGIIQDLFRPFHPDEIEHELLAALLTLAKRYQSHGNYFHTYVQRAYRFQLQRQLKNLVDTQLVTTHLPYFDESCQDELGDFSEDIIESNYYLINEPLDEVNENWINGLTTSDIFHALTKTQRRILKLYYVDDLTDDEIADKLGVCRATANRRRLRAVLDVEKEVEKAGGIIR